MSYFPVTPNRSGEILASGMMGAADAQAKMYDNLGENIGGALQTIGGVVGGVMQQNAAGDSAFEALRAIGEMYPGMKKTFGALEGMDPRTRRLASLSIIDNLGAISQLGIAGMNAGVRRDQMGVQMMMPRTRAAATAAGNAAAGQSTVRPLSVPGVDLNFVD